MVLDVLLALVAPPRCVACAAPTGAGRRLCRGCHGAMPWLTGALCPRCGLPQPCGTPCPARHAAYGSAWAPAAFEGPARALVHALKFDGRLAAAGVMAAHIAANAPAALLADAILVPVPTHPRRIRRRGFDHAARLARELGRRTRLPTRSALARTGPAIQQLGAGRAARQAAAGGGVEAAAPAPGRVVLVDDVHTTGATLDACSRALRAAGCASVVAVTYARTLP